MNEKLSVWNELIKIRDDKENKPMDRNHAEILLSQLNTASGSVIVKKEAESFLYNFKNKT